MVMVLVCLGALAGLMVTQLASTQRRERGVAANYEFTEIEALLNSIFEDAGSCALSGLVGYQFTSLTNLSSNPPFAVTVPGQAAPLVKVGSMVSSSQSVTQLQFTSLVDLDPLAPLSAKYYFATLNLQTQIINNATTAHSPITNFYLKVVVDQTKANPTITSCFQFKAATVVTASAQCAAGQVATAINADGSLTCVTSADNPDADSGWQNVPFTFTHNLGTMNYRVYVEIRQNSSSAPLAPVNQLFFNIDSIAFTQFAFSGFHWMSKTNNSIRVECDGFKENQSSTTPFSTNPWANRRPI